MRFRNELGQRGMEEYSRRKSSASSGLTREVISATGSKVRVSENTVVLEQTNQLRVGCCFPLRAAKPDNLLPPWVSGHPHNPAGQGDGPI